MKSSFTLEHIDFNASSFFHPLKYLAKSFFFFFFIRISLANIIFTLWFQLLKSKKNAVSVMMNIGNVQCKLELVASFNHCNGSNCVFLENPSSAAV